MKLQIESIDIKDVQSSSTTYISDHTLYINFEELEEIILKDERVKSLELNIVYPDDPVRIVNVVDVIQPRCKVDVENRDFPGWLGELKIAGQGKTRSLRGIAVILSNSYSKRPYSAIVDMFGRGSKMSKYGSMKNIIVHPLPSDNIDERDFESAVKLAGLKTAVYLAQVAKDCKIDQTDTFELDLPKMLHENKGNLPKVAYFYQLHTPQHDYQGIPDPILYGSEVTDLLPTFIHPNEILDGAIVNTHTIRGLDTYSIQNHGIIRELYKRHGTELLFSGVVIGVASVDPVVRQRMSMMAANLISNVLGAEGLILSKGHGGMSHVDLAFVGEACENLGIKTTLLIHMWHSFGSLSDQLLFNTQSLNALVNVGQVFERICLPHAEMILGGTPEAPVFNPDFKQTAGSAILDIEGYIQAGVYDHSGGAKIMVASY